MTDRIGDWCQVYSGAAFYPLDPRPDEIDIVDIAHALSMQCRYAGHVKYFYSVAEHSVLVARACSPGNRLWGLLHDASEAYLSDIVRPLKSALPEYKVIEDRVMQCVAQRFGLSWPMPQEVKELDYRVVGNERILLSPSRMAWSYLPVPIESVTINCWSPQVAKIQFLTLYYELRNSNENIRGMATLY